MTIDLSTPEHLRSPRILANELKGGAGLIVAEGMQKSFGTTEALRPFNIAVRPGLTGLLGPNGSGKSTFMRSITGLVPLDEGRANIDGVELEGDGTAVRRQVTYAPGELHLYGEMRANEHIDWLLRGRDNQARQRGRLLAAELGLPLEARVSSYSHGMKRQLVFAAAMAPEVRVRILDEPTDGLDPSKRSHVLELLEEDAARGTTVLLSSHHLGEVDRACGRLVFMNAGHVVADETADSVAMRASRLLRIAFPEGSNLDMLEDITTSTGARLLRQEDCRATVELSTDDPRVFLSSLGPLPTPSMIEFGMLSLPELYRDVYGVEGT